MNLCFIKSLSFISLHFFFVVLFLVFPSSFKVLFYFNYWILLILVALTDECYVICYDSILCQQPA